MENDTQNAMAGVLGDPERFAMMRALAGRIAREIGESLTSRLT